MPAVSAAQRAWAFAVKGAAWAREHHFDTPGKLPAHAKKDAARKAVKKHRPRRRI